MILCIATFTYFIKNRKNALIKATGLSISLIVLLGVFVSYPTALLMVSPPTPLLCNISSVGLHLGFCITYYSLLMVSDTI